MIKTKFLLALVLGLSCQLSHAGENRRKSGADALLERVAPQDQKPAKVENARPVIKMVSESGPAEEVISFDGSDTFLSTFFAERRSALPRMNFDVKSWSNRVLKGEWGPVAHQWSSVADQIPDEFVTPARLAYLRALKELGLAQSFAATYVEYAGDGVLTKSEVAKNLATQLGNIDNWLIKARPHLSSTQVDWLKKLAVTSPLLAEHPVLLTLKALVLRRSGVEAKSTLESLLVTHPMTVSLAQTASLGFIHKGDLGSAAQVMKSHLEPALATLLKSKGDDPGQSTMARETLALHYLNVARLLFQTGQMEAAQEFFEKVPSGSKYFLSAQEELSWVLLRLNNVARVRGQVESLASKVYSDRFQPEVPVVRAISNLKLCYYDKAQQDVEQMSRQYTPWAKRVESALQNSEAVRPLEPDANTLWVESQVAELTRESLRVHELGQESIKAVLPAVGIQKHWLELDKMLGRNLESAKQDLAAEYRRQWKNQQLALAEAVRKMRFVRLELLSQVRRLASEQKAKTEQVASLGALEARSVATAGGDLIYPFDGVVWPDEFFKLRSAAMNRCRSLGDLK